MLPLPAEDQARVITNILLAPEEHKGKVYPLYGEKEYTFAEIAAEISKVTGKPLVYEQIDAWDLKKLASKGAPAPEEPENVHSWRTHETDTIWQHFQEIAKDHQNGVFAGSNDLVEKIGGKPSDHLSGVSAGKPECVPRIGSVAASLADALTARLVVGGDGFPRSY